MEDKILDFFEEVIEARRFLHFNESFSSRIKLNGFTYVVFSFWLDGVANLSITNTKRPKYIFEIESSNVYDKKTYKVRVGDNKEYQRFSRFGDMDEVCQEFLSRMIKLKEKNDG